MPDYRMSIDRQYGLKALSERIIDRLREAGRDIDRLTRDDLAAFDEFHGGGRASTRSLARFAGVRAGDRVLDVGSGIGGPARTLAAEFGCRVTGLDLTESFVAAADTLTRLLAMQDAVNFEHGSALDMPLEDRGFDLVWSQNTLMNIEDKPTLLAEVFRVLKPGGRFAFEALMSGGLGEIEFPVFWSEGPALNFLLTTEDMQRQLDAVGFERLAWEDNTDQVMSVARKRLATTDAENPAPLDLSVIVQGDVGLKMRNALRNYESGRTLAVQAVYRRPRA